MVKIVMQKKGNTARIHKYMSMYAFYAYYNAIKK